MEIEFRWVWDGLDRDFGPDDDGHENVITRIHYSYIGEDGEGNSAGQHGALSLIRDEEDDWVEFDDITASDLESWALAGVGEERIAEMQDSLTAIISEKITPTHDIVHIMPWVEVEEDDGP